MAITLTAEEIVQLLSNKPPVNTLGELYARYPGGGELGWYAYVLELKSFAAWIPATGAWEMIQSSDGSGEFASQAEDSASSAASSEQTSVDAARDALDYKDMAKHYAIGLENTPNLSGEFSALHYAAKAKASELLAQSYKVETEGARDEVIPAAEEVMQAYPQTLTARDQAVAAEVLARKYAENAEDLQVVPGEFSAKHHALKAKASETAALESETNAGTYATNAQNSATLANTKASQASNSAVIAQQFASTPEDEPIQEDVYSALHYAAKAHESRDAAAVSASSANDKAILALSASTQAGLYKNAAEAAQIKAEEAEAAVESDRILAQTAASTATTQAGTATTQAGVATTQAGVATTQAGIATTKAAEAAAAYALLPNAEKALADIVAHLLGRIETLEQELSESKYNVMQVNELSVVDNLKIKGANLFLFGTAAPAVAPDFIGQFFIDTTAGVTYQAKGITNAADWKATSNA